MPESIRFRLRDIQDVTRILIQLNELPPCSHVWFQHLLASAATLVPCRFAILVEFDQFIPDRKFRVLQFYSVDHLDDCRRKAARECSMAEQTTSSNPILREMTVHSGPLMTVRRSNLVDDRTWCASPCLALMPEPASHDESLISHVHLDGGWGFDLGLSRPHGDGRFSLRERDLLELLHGNVRSVYQRVLAPEGARSPLPQRLRQILMCTLEGHGDKQIARRLNLSPHTVREYLTELHQRFGVSCRSELILRCLAPGALHRHQEQTVQAVATPAAGATTYQVARSGGASDRRRRGVAGALPAPTPEAVGRA